MPWMQKNKKRWKNGEDELIGMVGCLESELECFAGTPFKKK